MVPRKGRFPLQEVLSFPVLLGGLLAAGACVSTSLGGSVPGGKLFAEGDIWWHVVVGERILATGTWPTSDPYSFTAAGNYWIAYEWLGEVLMALAMRLGGLRGLAVLLMVLSACLILLLYYYAYLRSGNSKAAAVACALLLPVVGGFFMLRPQLLGYIFLMVTLICLERFRAGRQKALWFLPGVFLLWVNTHGTFAFGLLFLGVYWVSGLVSFRRGGLVAERWTEEQRRRLSMVTLLCVLTVLVNPYGTRLGGYLLDAAFFQPVNFVVSGEWNLLPCRDDPTLKLLLGLVTLAFLAYVLFFPFLFRLEEMAVLIFAAYEGFLHFRFLLLFVLVFAAPLAALLARLIPKYEAAKDRPSLNAVLLLLAFVGLGLFFPSNQDLQGILERRLPKRAVDYLRQHPNVGPAFNEIDWGGYLILSGRKVFVDGRADAYEHAGVLADYVRIKYLDPKTPFLLRKYGVEACLINWHSPMVAFLRALPDWEQVYADEISLLFVRTGSSLAAGGEVSMPAPTACCD